MIKVSQRQNGGVTILDVMGKITIGAGDLAVRNAVQEALNAGATGLLVNLQGVSTIDSSGIGELVSAFTTAANRGVKLKLLHLPPKVNDVLQITHLITVFDVFENEDEAVKSFS